MRLPRRRRVPDAVASVELLPGERRSAWALTPDGEPVVATEAALLLPGGVRLEWRRVERAAWQPPRLTVLEVADVEGTGARHTHELSDEGDLPAVVHSRVTASVAWTDHARLSPAGGVRVVGRRVPDAELLEWQLVYDVGTDREDPLVRAQAEQLVAQARRSIG